MANIVQSVDDRSYRARADRSIQSGRVVSLDKTAGEAVLDVGMIDADGSPVYMHGAPFSPQTPQQVNDTVAIQRTSSSPYSFTLGSGAQVGGGNSGQVVQNGGVSSLAKSGSTKLKNDVTLTAGANITLTESGQDISIAAAASSLTPASTVTDVAAADAVGASLNYAREDHAHKGVHTLAKSGSAGLPGDVTLTGTGGIALTQSGQNIAIDGSGVSGGPSPAATVTDVGASDVVGTATNYAREDHAHKGVHSVAKSGGTALFGDVTLTGTGGIVLNEAGNNIAIDASNATGGGLIDGYQSPGVTGANSGGELRVVVYTGATGSTHSFGLPVCGSAAVAALALAFLVINGDNNFLTVTCSGTDTFEDLTTSFVLQPGQRAIFCAVATGEGIWRRYGYTPELRLNSQSGSAYGFGLGDVGGIVEFSNAGSITATIPVSGSVRFPIGAVINVVQVGAGAVHVLAASGVTIRSRGSLTATNGQYATIRLRQSSLDTWYLDGDLA